MKIEQVGLYVQDLDQTVAFYETYFEATAAERYHNPKTTFTSRFLSFPAGARLEVCTRAELTKRLVAAGDEKLSGPRTTGDGYFESVVLDPEGNQIELTV